MGRPLLYGTTPLLLELLGLRDLAELPRTEEFSVALHSHKPETADSDEAAASVPAES
jgi:chromosome segregation and condensation protein ScpB